MVVGTTVTRRRNRVGLDRRKIRWCRRRGRQKTQRIHVTIWLVGPPDAEVDERLGCLTD
jgi:hypothetical protein